MIMSKWNSRKLIVSFLSALFIILNEGLGWGIDPEMYWYLAGIVITYLATQGWVDKNTYPVTEGKKK